MTTSTESMEAAPKQYLLMVNDVGMALISRVIAGLQFLEVQGLTVKDNPNLNLLASPVAMPLEMPIGDSPTLDNCINAPQENQ